MATSNTTGMEGVDGGKDQSHVNGEHHPNGTDPTSTSASTPDSKPRQAYPHYQPVVPLPTPPFIDVSGIPNFRDIGGYLTKTNTHMVRPQFMYRCAQPTQVTHVGFQTLISNLGVRAIFDLRSAPEVARTNASVMAASTAAISNQPPPNTDGSTTSSLPPLPPAATPEYQSIRQFTPVFTDEDNSPEALARKLKWYTSPDAPSQLPYSYSEGFVNAYRDIATHGVAAYHTMFHHILTRPNDPLLFHCTAGKDRTGVFAALVLRLAGVDDETICWEYALTEPGLGSWRVTFIERMCGGGANSPATSNTDHNTKTNVTSPSGHAMETITRDEAARIAGSRAGNMRAWLTLVLDGEFGGIDRYMTERLKFTPQEVLTIRANIVVDLSMNQDLKGHVSIIRPEDIVIQNWTPEGGMAD